MALVGQIVEHQLMGIDGILTIAVGEEHACVAGCIVHHPGGPLSGETAVHGGVEHEAYGLFLALAVGVGLEVVLHPQRTAVAVESRDDAALLKGKVLVGRPTGDEAAQGCVGVLVAGEEQDFPTHVTHCHRGFERHEAVAQRVAVDECVEEGCPFCHHRSVAHVFIWSMSVSEELRESLDRVDMVGRAARLTAAVHRQDGIAHVDAAQRQRRRQDIAQGAATGHVGVVDEALAGHTGLSAYLGEDGGRDGVAGILLCGIELDDWTAAEHGMVRRVVLLAVVGMPGMGVVG